MTGMRSGIHPRRLRLHLESEAPTGVRSAVGWIAPKKAAIMREKTLDWGKKKKLHRLRREEECCKEGVSLAVSQLHSLAVSYGRG